VKILKQYSWIISILVAIILVAIMLMPSKKNQLEFIEQRIDDIQNQREVLTEKEKELEKLATEKEWEEVDKDSNK
jgi:F0F1-type ATP synthase membrane subunit b/b'